MQARFGWWVMAVVLSSGCASQSPPAKTPAEPASPATQSLAARSQEDLRRQVLELLSGYEAEPTADDWKRVGPGVLPVLEQLYADPSVLPTRRTRAVSAMSRVDDARAEKVLQDIALDPNADVQFRSTAVQAYADRVGPSAAQALGPLLGADNERLRETTARALGAAGGDQARVALEVQLGKESDPQVREAIQQSLTKLKP